MAGSQEPAPRCDLYDPKDLPLPLSGVSVITK
jgi:hypothetical protein